MYMKRPEFKKTFSIVLLLLLAGGCLQAQTPVTATWALTTDAAAVVNGTGATASVQVLKGLAVAAKNPYSDKGQRSATGAVGGPWVKEAGPAQDRYFLYSITPVKGYTLSVSQVTIDLCMEGTNSNGINIAWAIDTTAFTNLAPNFPIPGNGIPVTKTYTIAPVTVPAGASFYVRVSPWTTGNASAAKFLVSRNVVITGTSNKQ